MQENNGIIHEKLLINIDTGLHELYMETDYNYTVDVMIARVIIKLDKVNIEEYEDELKFILDHNIIDWNSKLRI